MMEQCVVPSTTGPTVTMSWTFKGEKKIKASSSSNLIQYPWSKVCHWQGRKLGWTRRHIRCDCIHKISGKRENQFNGTVNVLSISECFFLILSVLIESNPTGKCHFIANSWLNIMNFCSDDGTYHCANHLLVFEITVNNHSGISCWM